MFIAFGGLLLCFQFHWHNWTGIHHRQKTNYVSHQHCKLVISVKPLTKDSTINELYNYSYKENELDKHAAPHVS